MSVAITYWATPALRRSREAAENLFRNNKNEDWVGRRTKEGDGKYLVLNWYLGENHSDIRWPHVHSCLVY